MPSEHIPADDPDQDGSNDRRPLRWIDGATVEYALTLLIVGVIVIAMCELIGHWTAAALTRVSAGLASPTQRP